MKKLSSYQRRLEQIANLEKRVWRWTQIAQFFQGAIWDAREATGESLGIKPFSDMRGNEEGSAVTDREGLLEIIRNLPLHCDVKGVGMKRGGK